MRFHSNLIDPIPLPFQTARCKRVIGDPSYFPDKVKKVGQVSELHVVARSSFDKGDVHTYMYLTF